MSTFLSSLGGKLKEWKEAGEKSIARFNNSTFATAAMSVCALVAAADGQVSAEEKTKTAKAIANTDQLKPFNATDLQTKFKEAIGKLEADIDFGKVELLSNIAKCKGDPDEATQLARLGIIIGGADGNFDEKEKAVMKEIVKELKLDPAEFNL